MTQQKHASREELQELILGGDESERVHRVGEHVHRCQRCREELEALAARSAIWRMAPELLKGAPLATHPICPIESGSVQNDFRADGLSSNDWEQHWPLNDFLDRPSHPEMLGRIGRYDVEREVGRGGMGVVLKAYDSELNRPVAIKILAPHLANHGTARRRFAQEAIAAGGILHPNVIPVYGVNNEGKTPFFVMPFVEGPSLQTLVDHNGPLTETEITRVALQISSGLSAAHAQGLVHRDIKPANILVDGGVHRVIITDFGLARAEDDASLTRTGWLMGTPNYMSPEQTRGQRSDSRSDLFSLGSLMYFLASGRLPFRAESALGVLHRIQNDEPTPIRQVNREISRTLSSVIEKLLQKSPQDRFQSSDELHKLLEHHLAHLYQPDITGPPNFLSVQPHSSSKWKLALGLSLLVGTATAVAFGYSQWRPTNSTLSGIISANDDPPPGSDEPAKPQAFPLAIVDDESATTCEGNEIAPEVSNDAPPTVWRTSQICGSNGGDEVYSLAENLYHQGRFKESLAGFQKAAEFECQKANSLYNLGCVYLRLNQPDAALESLKQAVAAGYQDVNNIQTDTDLDALRGDERFIALIQRIQELNRANELVKTAKSEARQQNLSTAEGLLREALALNSDSMEGALTLGYVLHMQGKLEEALPWHEKASNWSEDGAQGTYNIACYHAVKANSDLAFQFLNQSVRLGLARSANAQQVKEDPDFKAIANDSRFADVVSLLEDHERMWQKGLDPVLVDTYRSVGLETSELENQIREGIPASLVADYRSAGLDLDEHDKLLRNHVPSQLIVSYRNASLDIQEHESALLLGLEPGSKFIQLDGAFHRDDLKHGDSSIETWLKKSAVPFDGSTVDFGSLENIFAKAKVVAVGEATHGQHEVFEIKRHLTMHLIRNHGFRLVAYEASASQMLKANAYISDDSSDVDRAMSGFGMLIWQIKENLTLLNDLKEWNRNAPIRDRVRIIGCDAQDSDAAMTRLIQLLGTEHPETTSKIRELTPRVTSAVSDLMAGKQGSYELISTEIEALKQRLKECKPSSPAEIEEYELRVQEYGSSLTMFASQGGRDRAMADLLLMQLSKEGPSSRCVVWSHNAHVQKSPMKYRQTDELAMGGHLAERLGDSYYAVGVAFGEGEFQANAQDASGKWGFKRYRLSQAPTGSLEATLASTGHDRYLLDLRYAPNDRDVRDWLNTGHGHRWFGGYKVPDNCESTTQDAATLMQMVPIQDFDGLLFVSKTTSAEPIDTKRILTRVDL